MTVVAAASVSSTVQVLLDAAAMLSDRTREHMAAARLGRVLREKWKLTALLGVGGMASVYAAVHRNGGRVAVKMLHPELSAAEGVRDAFLREAYLQNRIDHPGVARVLDDDVDETDGSVYLIMDLLPGISLADRASLRLLEGDEALEVAEQVLEVLVAAHAMDIVHRDLKPQNVLVDEDGTIRLVDFGIATCDDDDWPTVNRSGTVYGTPGYMAPEQILGLREGISPRTDIYALGATLFTTISGQPTHLGADLQERMLAAMKLPARSLAVAAPGVSADVAALVDRALAFDPRDRWPTAAAMLVEVQRLKALRGLPAAPIRPRPSKRKISSRLRAVCSTPPPRSVVRSNDTVTVRLDETAE